MRALDRFLQAWRIRIAARYIPDNSRVLDIGCHQGELFDYLGSSIRCGVGIDPLVERENESKLCFIRGSFPMDFPAERVPFDVITLLAVMEHVPLDGLDAFAMACNRALSAGGRLIATVPSPIVDTLLHLGRRAGWIDGMSMEEHHGFAPADMVPLFERNGFRLLRWTRFQLGLNNIFIFRSTR